MCFWQEESFLTFDKNLRESCSLGFSERRNLPEMCGLAWRLSSRVFGVHNSCLSFFFLVGHLFMTREHAIPSCPGPRIARPRRPGCPARRFRAGLWCSLSLQRGVYISSASKVHKPPFLPLVVDSVPTVSYLRRASGDIPCVHSLLLVAAVMPVILSSEKLI